jgi:hypothetical protein
MPFDFGDVVLVPFPFTSQRASKKRPAVVVSNRTYATTRGQGGRIALRNMQERIDFVHDLVSPFVLKCYARQ